MAEETNAGDNPVAAVAEAPAKKKAAKRKAKKVAARAKSEKKVVVEPAPAARKKTAKKKTAKKKVAAKKTVARAAEPKARAKKKAVSRRGAVSMGASPEAAGAGERRRGRPVSVDLLRRRLDKAQQLARSEKDKRRAIADQARKVIAEHVSRNKTMRTELAAARRELDRLVAATSSAERSREREQQLETAREAAVQKFLAGWEKDFLKQQARPKARRGRPRGRRSRS